MKIVAERVYVADPDLVTEWLEHVQIWMCSSLDTSRVAKKRTPEGKRGRPFADPGRTVEHISVSRSLAKGRAQ